MFEKKVPDLLCQSCYSSNAHSLQALCKRSSAGEGRREDTSLELCFRPQSGGGPKSAGESPAISRLDHPLAAVGLVAAVGPLASISPVAAVGPVIPSPPAWKL